MKQKEQQHRWEFDLRSSPEALWPFVADTNRFNKDAGLPNIAEADASKDAAPSKPDARRRLRVRLVGFDLISWEEEPFEWVRPHGFGVLRRYARGPVSEMRVGVELTSRADGGTRLVYKIRITPRAAVVRVALPLQLKIMRRKFERTFRRYDRLAQSSEAAHEAAATTHLSPQSQLTKGGRARLASMKDALAAEGSEGSLVEKLAELIERGDDFTLARMRPYALADEWGSPRRDVLELCLRATRAGLLDFRWDILCPLCRGAKATAGSLREVSAGQHCDTCKIDFAVNFDRQVEITFRPNAAVRRVEAADYCMGGPRMTPHVVVQQLLEPGEARTVRPLLEEGRYRLRTLGLAGGQFLDAAGAGAGEVVTLRAGAGAWPGGELSVAASPSLSLENASAGEQLFILERTAWSDGAVTAAEVTALQLFRDLFADEALRPGEQITVGSMTLLFTDLRGSTQLYRQIGDAVAFGAVMNHFDVLREAIAAEGGTIVKTLGDAVMGAFTRPAPALRAVLRAQALLASPPEGVRPLALKAAVHAGPCIAVTLNDRLDYFGSNVNIAARLEPLSTGADCVISSAVREDPSVSDMLAGEGLAVEPLSTKLKGFDEESFELWRVMRKEESPRETERRKPEFVT